MAFGSGSRPNEAISKLWWLWLVFGFAWTFAAVVILQFDQASVTTVGIIVGIMFFAGSVQNFAIATLAERGRWIFLTFGVLFAAGGVVTFISPENTFVALADILGFLFVMVGIFWLLQAFTVREVSELWWLGLVSGILMVMLGFWTGGQFFSEKQYLLLVFAGIWSLMQGITDIARAFQIRKIGELA